ncbi:beta-mannosidase [Paenibacillus gansuensis]|uniref:Beta-mannosidase B n=1 Tax=Paenibacillus gansuensis TaxID=306542 RepID=A0ABW5PEI8_9BACL
MDMNKGINMALSDWRFKSAKEQEWLPARVPGCVHTDLLTNGIIPDPFYGTNERDLQWIDKQDWEYESVFDVSGDMLAQTQIELIFDGLDTYADVVLNDKPVLAADNMFRTWSVDVRSLLRPAGNRLSIRFRSPIMEDLPKLEKLGYALPATNDQSEHGGLGDRKVSVFARKAPFHYGWDWGPRFVTSGIWREVRLEAWSGLRIKDLYIRQDDVTAEQAIATAVVEIEADSEFAGTLQLSAGDFQWERQAAVKPGLNVIEVPCTIEHPQLWWPRGLGEASLYTFTAAYSTASGQIVKSSVRTGLRSVRLVREPDREGTSFYIEVNGVPVFAKGANHIPNDSFVTEVTRERYEHEIASAAKSNMNMLRVWGGGIYEESVFYDLCDEYGMLVWQDFMFACSMYPGDEGFLESIRAEARDNVRRLRKHPSIALWCGNNEMDTAWSHYDEQAGWGWKQQYSEEIRNRIWADYEAIFHRVLPEELAAHSPKAEYWPSSPMQAVKGNKDQHAFNSSTEGDIHYWGVWHNVEPFSNYNIHIGRFMSEYGFQSFPEHRSVLKYASENDMELESDVMLSHQRNNRGNQLIKEYMDMYLPEPKDFPSFLYMSQVLQAEAMKTAIEAHRRRMPFCMGSLYWQMNDCWPVASWAGMDYYGRWKALQYYAARSFADVLLSVDDTKEGQLEFYIVSDRLEALSGTLSLTLYDFSGILLNRWSVPAEAGVNTAQLVHTVKTEDLLQAYPAGRSVLVAEWEQNGGSAAASLFHYFVPAKQIELKTPAITIKEERSGLFTLETDVLAKQVWLTAEEEGMFSDNFFDLLPGVPVTVQFIRRRTPEESTSANFFVPGSPAAVEVRSMADFVTK